ncbi:MAG: hypothetical protein WC783_04825 [Candidatus Paceibacterota bacterium]
MAAKTQPESPPKFFAVNFVTLEVAPIHESETEAAWKEVPLGKEWLLCQSSPWGKELVVSPVPVNVKEALEVLLAQEGVSMRRESILPPKHESGDDRRVMLPLSSTNLDDAIAEIGRIDCGRSKQGLAVIIPIGLIRKPLA